MWPEIQTFKSVDGILIMYLCVLEISAFCLSLYPVSKSLPFVPLTGIFLLIFAWFYKSIFF